jgi:anti-sigma B factor antagonist
MSDDIIIEHHSAGNIEVVKVSGFMDMRHVGPFTDFLDRLILAKTWKIVLDFTDLEYISSAGLGAIIGRIRDVRAKSGDIKIGGCSRPVQDILNVFGFAAVFTLTATPQDAVKMFGA